MKHFTDILSSLMLTRQVSPWDSPPVEKLLGSENRGRKTYANDVALGLQNASANNDADLLGVLLEIAFFDGVTKLAVAPLVDLLQKDFHESHEDIATLLEDLAEPASVGALFGAAISIPEFDDGRSLAKKCLSALAAINSPEAISKIQSLSQHPDAIVAQAARRYLSG
jgi:hypothetical protein